MPCCRQNIVMNKWWVRTIAWIYECSMTPEFGVHTSSGVKLSWWFHNSQLQITLINTENSKPCCFILPIGPVSSAFIVNRSYFHWKLTVIPPSHVPRGSWNGRTQVSIILIFWISFPHFELINTSFNFILNIPLQYLVFYKSYTMYKSVINK